MNPYNNQNNQSFNPNQSFNQPYQNPNNGFYPPNLRQNFNIQNNIAPKLIPFNRGFLDYPDPLKDIGVNLDEEFGLATSYLVEPEYHGMVLSDLYSSVLENIEQNPIPNTKREICDFQDMGTVIPEAPRRYIIITTETPRQIKLSVYITFISYGNTIYLSVSSFILGALSWRKFLLKLLFVFWPILLVTFIFHSFLLLIPALILSLIFGWGYGLNIIRASRNKEPLSDILRKLHPKTIKNGSFTTDDALMFFKNVVPGTIRSIKKVLEKRGLPVEVLDAAISNINYVTTINTGGGAFNGIGLITGGTNTISPNNNNTKG